MRVKDIANNNETCASASRRFNAVFRGPATDSHAARPLTTDGKLNRQQAKKALVGASAPKVEISEMQAGTQGPYLRMACFCCFPRPPFRNSTVLSSSLRCSST